MGRSSCFLFEPPVWWPLLKSNEAAFLSVYKASKWLPIINLFKVSCLSSMYLQLLVGPLKKLNFLCMLLFLDCPSFSFSLLNGFTLGFQFIDLPLKISLVSLKLLNLHETITITLYSNKCLLKQQYLIWCSHVMQLQWSRPISLRVLLNAQQQKGDSWLCEKKNYGTTNTFLSHMETTPTSSQSHRTKYWFLPKYIFSKYQMVACTNLPFHVCFSLLSLQCFPHSKRNTAQIACNKDMLSIKHLVNSREGLVQMGEGYGRSQKLWA